MAQGSDDSNSVLIINARLIDGTGGGPCENVAVLVRDGKIAAIGPDLSQDPAVEGVRVLDAAGGTVMPGLIDAHVHLQSVPGSMHRQDSQERLDRFRLHHLRAYLACGVTTVLDNGISPSMLRQLQEHVRSTGAGPRICAVAPAFYPPGGYLDGGMLSPYWGPHWKAAGSREDVQSLFAEYEGLENIVGAKVLLEPGFGVSAIWPIHSPEMRRIIVEEAGKRNLPLYIHAYKKREQKISLEMGIHNFAHSGFLEGSPSREFLAQVKEAGAYVTTTLASTMEQLLVNFDMARLDDDLLRLAVPREELDTARSPEAWREMLVTFLSASKPKWMPSFLMRMIIKKMNIEKEVRTRIENASQAILAMHQAGIPIALGTDTANWPLFLNFFHGPSTIREVELLGQAGMSPLDVLSSATRIPAKMMGLDYLIGTVEVGKRADLIVVQGDPLQDLSALKFLSWVIKDGVARTPSEWMAE